MIQAPGADYINYFVSDFCSKLERLSLICFSGLVQQTLLRITKISKLWTKKVL
jgi:hypothetical protein